MDFSKDPNSMEKRQLGLKPPPNSRVKVLMFQIAEFEGKKLLILNTTNYWQTILKETWPVVCQPRYKGLFESSS